MRKKQPETEVNNGYVTCQDLTPLTPLTEMIRKRAIQICGTGSGVGKSVIVAGLCRIFLQDGLKVAPFKAQNMSLNSFVTPDGGEIGRAQATQAQACRLKPTVDMNPILIKPTSDTGAQIILHGKPLRNMSALEYRDYKCKAQKEVLASFKRLKDEFEVVVIEGAGSPAEINLKAHDIVNMKMAQAAEAPVILVGDIDKGGVFAWLVGTLELLTKRERKRIKGFIINKFRGDKTLLKPGIDFLEKKAGIKVLGVVPYFKDIKIPEEDSVFLGNLPSRETLTEELLNINVIRLPYISNFTDFDALENEPDVRLQYAEKREDLDGSDIIIIPGTKSTVADLDYLKESGLAEKILSIIKARPETILIGICGGYQMLGQRIYDLDKTESKGKEAEGLGILPIVTNFKKEKILAQIKAKEITSGLEVSGYEIHHGQPQKLKNYQPAFQILERQGQKAQDFEGAIIEEGRIWGTHIHGVFDEDTFRRDILNRVRLKKGWQPLTQRIVFNLDKELDKLAKLLRRNLDIGLLYEILRKEV